MQKLIKTNNDYAFTIKLLIKYHSRGMSMKEAGLHWFNKFQSRLGEIEQSMDSNGEPRSLSLKIRRLPMEHKKPWGTKTKFLNYKSLASHSYLVNLHNKLSREGLFSNKKDATLVW
jgi:hypothetical protein